MPDEPHIQSPLLHLAIHLIPTHAHTQTTGTRYSPAWRCGLSTAAFDREGHFAAFARDVLCD